MSKTLSNILTIFKIAKVLAKIVFICCIIGAVGCAAAIFFLPVVDAVMPDEILIATGSNIETAYFAVIIAIFACVGEAVFAFLAERYFKNVLTAESPFTFKSAKECFRLGVTSIVISFAVSIISGIISAAAVAFTDTAFADLNISTAITVSTGLFFMFISMLFKYGAEQQERSSEETTKE